MSKKTIPTWLSVVLLILAVATIVFYINLAILCIVKGYSFVYTLTAILSALSAVSAILYFANGYKKKAASYYHGFFVIYTVMFMFNIYSSILIESWVSIITSVISFGAVSMVAGSKDLGRVNTHICGGIVAICAVVNVFVNMSAIFTGGEYCQLSALVIVALMLIMMHAKYKDKEARGTK